MLSVTAALPPRGDVDGLRHAVEGACNIGAPGGVHALNDTRSNRVGDAGEYLRNVVVKAWIFRVVDGTGNTECYAGSPGEYQVNFERPGLFQEPGNQRFIARGIANDDFGIDIVIPDVVLKSAAQVFTASPEYRVNHLTIVRKCRLRTKQRHYQ